MDQAVDAHGMERRKLIWVVSSIAMNLCLLQAHYSSFLRSSIFRDIFGMKKGYDLPDHERGTMILTELPYSLAIAVISDTFRLFIIHVYNHP